MAFEDVNMSFSFERLMYSYESNSMQIGFSSPFLIETLSNLNSKNVMVEMSLPNRISILTPLDDLDNGETIIMFGYACYA